MRALNDNKCNLQDSHGLLIVSSDALVGFASSVCMIPRPPLQTEMRAGRITPPSLVLREMVVHI